MGFRPPGYSFDDQGRFVIEEYNWAPAFSNYFPGIAGLWGIPAWCFSVSRRQAICGLGVRDKDGAVLEFQSFNRFLHTGGRNGFRTFLRIDGCDPYEPFLRQQNLSILQRMRTSAHGLVLEEEHQELEFSTKVEYFALSGMATAGLVRRVRITNSAAKGRDFEILDGPARVIPYGVSFEHLSVIPRHIEGMMGCFQVDGTPVFRLKQTAADIDRIGEVEAMHFFLSRTADKNLPPDGHVVDPGVVFGFPDEMECPLRFAEMELCDLLKADQVTETRTPCAMSGFSRRIEPGDSFEWYSVLGYAPDPASLDSIKEQLIQPDFMAAKQLENRGCIEEIRSRCLTLSAEPVFDQYCQETFLENVMRGGIPIFHDSVRSSTPHYVYARQNGDMERDYHWFVIEPTYFSQGNGHFRSICQNRRMDSWFYPEVGRHNIRIFAGLLQLDGYNPLEVNGVRYRIVDRVACVQLLESWFHDNERVSGLMELVDEPFSLGELLMELLSGGISRDETLNLAEGILDVAVEEEIGGIHEGYWIDHWAYILDLIDSHLQIFPEDRHDCYFEQSYTFFDNPDVVVQRVEKYHLEMGQMRQYGAVVRDPEKQKLIDGRSILKNRMRIDSGRGEIYETTLYVKLLCAVVCKLAALDQSGAGVEMEAGKPGWNDSLNGLPGLFGSSLCQTLELLRGVRMLREVLDERALESDILIFSELWDFIQKLNTIFSARIQGEDDLASWDAAHTALETYRQCTRMGIDGKEINVPVLQMAEFLRIAEEMLEDTFSSDNQEKYLHPDGVPLTYRMHTDPVLDNDSPAGDQLAKLNAGAIHLTAAPRFLEGPVHYARVFPERAGEVHRAVRASSLFDSELFSYKVCESLADAPRELGRITAYSPGWIENESIYTHMLYKWLNELICHDPCEETFSELHRMLIPFLDPEKYARSTLENCSFIAGSAFPDQSMRGRAFQPLLSGVTAEMLQMWCVMTAGPRPFNLNDQHELQLKLDPILPSWLFTTGRTTGKFWRDSTGYEEVVIPSESFGFLFLGKVPVIYHNPARKHTAGPGSVHPARIEVYRDGNSRTAVDAPVISGQLAEAVRRGEMSRLEIWLS